MFYFHNDPKKYLQFRMYYINKLLLVNFILNNKILYYPIIYKYVKKVDLIKTKRK
jgi:hypothetical protein